MTCKHAKPLGPWYSYKNIHNQWENYFKHLTVIGTCKPNFRQTYQTVLPGSNIKYSPPPLLWNFQFSFILFFKNFSFCRTPPFKFDLQVGGGKGMDIFCNCTFQNISTLKARLRHNILCNFMYSIPQERLNTCCLVVVESTLPLFVYLESEKNHFTETNREHNYLHIIKPNIQLRFYTTKVRWHWYESQLM